MIPNPILKILTTISSQGVRHLLMGGQACVFYGAAEFSRDCDIVIVADDENLMRLNTSLVLLQANCIALPPHEKQFWDRGHAIHFRCQHPDALGIRLDVMTKMRGCDPFDKLWERRTTLADAEGTIYELLGIEDLVKSKKTQRDKDWPMIQRLVDAHYERFRDNPTDEQVAFWLRECRTPEVLTVVTANYPAQAHQLIATRTLLSEAFSGDETALLKLLREEQAKERDADAIYWQPLKDELQRLRSIRTKDKND